MEIAEDQPTSRRGIGEAPLRSRRSNPPEAPLRLAEGAKRPLPAPTMKAAYTTLLFRIWMSILLATIGL